MKFKFTAILFLAFLSLTEAQFQRGEKTAEEIRMRSRNKGLHSTDSILTRPYSTDSQIYQRKFRPDFKKNYRGPSFNYETVKPRISLWQRLSGYIEMLLQKLFGNAHKRDTGKTIMLILKLLSLAVCAFLLYFLLNFIVRKNGRLFFGKANKKAARGAQDLAEDIHEINFSEAIATAEAAQDYRSAVRYRFLKVLKELSDSQMIRWNPEKTNQDYIRELKNAAVAEKFRRLAHIYDYVWYGEFEISASEYALLRKNFEENILKP